jgi:uncharacterized membrane protein
VLIARILHIVGNILWLGGGAACALAAVMLASESKETRAAAAKALRTVVLYVVTPGMLLGWAGGLHMLLAHWSDLYSKAPWIHTKLTIGLVAAAFSGVLSGGLRRAASSGDELSPGRMRLAGIVLLLSAVAGASLAFLRPGG